MINIFGGDVNLSAPRGGVWAPAFQSILHIIEYEILR